MIWAERISQWPGRGGLLNSIRGSNCGFNPESASGMSTILETSENLGRQ